jgi:hypothetical protein
MENTMIDALVLFGFLAMIFAPAVVAASLGKNLELARHSHD